ncbi:unnamed protein product [Candidula unifasciata]|uniref:phosphatidylinositol-3,5-bisphosphate 3-phosphatase n=1 Tax=Candidula unifasciata TaxID=100452 RepID=A0A8S3ZQC7_9EUPU|nr:unnamed protein product [Candidula unifasciata]
MDMNSKPASPHDRSNPSIQTPEKLDVDCLQVPPLQRSNPLAQLPSFPTLTGEYPILISKTADGSAMVTNFRFYACEQRSFINIPLMMVAELIVIEAAKRLRIGCKDGATYSCTFATNEDLTACTNLLKEKTGLPANKKTLFAYRFYEVAMRRKELKSGLTKLEEEHIQLCEPVDLKFAYSFDKEVVRLGFDTNKEKIWRMSHANENFEFCPTYPKLHILPATVDDDKLKVSLDFRAMKRFPSVVWRDRRTGMVLIRSSQPLSSFLGVSYFTNQSDVFLIEEIVNACNKDWKLIEEHSKSVRALPDTRVNDSHGQEKGQEFSAHKGDGAQGSLVSDDPAGANDHGASNGNCYYDDGFKPKKLAIVDCRSLAGVWGNSFKGGGTEDEVVYKCNIVHLDLANIHTVRDSFNKLRALCHAYVEGTFYKNLTGCMWLTYISALLRGANIVVELMHVMKRPVLVHCSDGWDRTSQIVSLSELMMDPYYRTLEGFQVLVEREWLHFGHKFGERGGHDPSCSDTSQMSPIFLQFLDCVHQLTLQYPAEFQFNEAYLVKLLQNSQSCLFGNFLYNCQKERENCSQKTASVWSLLKPERSQFVNLLYRPADNKVLTAKVSEHEIVLWKSVYMAGLSPMLHFSQTDFGHELAHLGGGEDTSNPSTDGLPRSKSADDMSKISVDSGRRNSDPSITQSQELISVSPAGTHSLHDDSLLLHPKQHQGEPAHLLQSQSPTVQLKECVGDGSRVVSSTSSSIERSSSQHSCCSTDSLDKLQIECATISPSLDVVQLYPDKMYVNGHSCDAELSSEPVSIKKIGPSLLSEDSGAHSLDALSSAVFCQENGLPLASSEQTVCCDSHMISNDSQVLSERTPLSAFNDSPCTGIASCNGGWSKICDKLVDNFASRTNSSLKYDSFCGSATSACNSELILLMSERSALSADIGLTQNAKSETCCLTNGTVHSQRNGDDREHSMNSEELCHITAALKAQVSRKLHETSGHLNGHYTDGGRMCKQVMKAGIEEPNCYNNIMLPKKLLNCPQRVDMDSSRSSINSVSTDTLNGDLDAGNDILSPPLPSFSKPLEVNTHDDKLTVAVPVKTALHSSSVLKVNGYPSEDMEISGSNLVSRRARAASGASRDLSVSPCACRRQLSDAGRLLYSNGSELISRRILGATVATSTTDISDSHVAQLRQPSISQHIDVDGLTLFCDERQDLLAQVIAEKDRKIEDLRFKLNYFIEMSRGFMSHQQQPQPALLDDLVNDSDGGELVSLGAISNASDASWEAVEKSEAEIIMWVPDAAVTHCAGCDAEFRMLRRKHHCRNCGKVFCADCSDRLAPVPHQHLNNPERVCRRCYSHLVQLSPGASSDGRIPTLVANG